MAQPQLFPLIRARVRALLNGYVNSPALDAGLDQYIQPPALAPRSGVLGAFALAELAAGGADDGARR
jgi:fructokinase